MPKAKQGFALVFVLGIISLVSALCVLTSTLLNVEYRVIKHKQLTQKAKEKALFALDVAISQLEEHLCKDYCVSTTPYLNAGHPKRYWLGVWDTTQPVLSIEPNSYLVSYDASENSPTFTFFKQLPNNAVTVHKLPILDHNDNQNKVGYYAYWISNESVKAKIHLSSKHPGKQLPQLGFFYLKEHENASFINNLKSIHNWTDIINKDFFLDNKAFDDYHHYSLYSNGLLVENENLNACYKKNLLTALDQELLDNTHSIIKDFCKLQENIEKLPIRQITPKPFLVEYTDHSILNKSAGIGPILSSFQVYLKYIFDPQDYNIKVFYDIYFSLWNPYSLALKEHEYEIEVASIIPFQIPIKICTTNSQDSSLSIKASNAIIYLSSPIHNASSIYKQRFIKGILKSEFNAGQEKWFRLKISQDNLFSNDNNIFIEESKHPIHYLPYTLHPLQALEVKNNQIPYRKGLHAVRQPRQIDIKKPEMALEAISYIHWPASVIKVKSTDAQYTQNYVFHEVYFNNIYLDSKSIAITETELVPSPYYLNFCYQLRYQKNKNFYNNPRGFFFCHQHIENTDYTWQLYSSFQSGKNTPIKINQNLNGLAVFDIPNELYSIADLAHAPLNLDYNEPAYNFAKNQTLRSSFLKLFDSYFIPNCLIEKNKNNTPSYSLINGAFNINSRSPKAWTALLMCKKYPEDRPGTFSRFDDTPTHDPIDQDQVLYLAENIVSELNQNPPHGSISSFIERNIIQKALDKFQSKAPSTSLGVSQNDILKKIGSFLTTQSDTFIIRAYGEYFNKPLHLIDNPKEKVSACCEAIVQRLPNTKRADNEHSYTIKIIHLKWIDPNKL